MLNQGEEFFDGVEFAEIPISTVTKGQFNFPKIEILKGKIIKAFQLYNATDFTNTPNGSDNLNDAAFDVGFMVIHEGERERINRVAFSAFRPAETSGRLRFFDMDQIDWQKSFVIFSDKTVLVQDQVVFVQIWYIDPVLQAQREERKFKRLAELKTKFGV